MPDNLFLRLRLPFIHLPGCDILIDLRRLENEEAAK